MEQQNYYDCYERTQYEDISLEFSECKQVKARYIRQSDNYDTGNRLIEALPPFRTSQKCYEDFEKDPFWNPGMRGKGVEERRNLVSHLSEFRIARSFVGSIDEEIYRTLIQSYRLRKERLDFISNPDIQNHYIAIEGKVAGMLVAGGSGTGKTTAVRHALDYYPQVIEHEFPDSRMYQVTYIKVECPADGSIKNFFDLCLGELEKAVGCDLKKGSCKTADAKSQLFRNQAARFNLGILVIDEIQNLLAGKKQDIMNHFLTLSNDIKVPFIFIGTNEILQYLQKSRFFIQRRIGVEIRIDRFENDLIWLDFMKKLWRFQWTKEAIPFSEEFGDAFYQESGGIIDRVVALYERAQFEAIWRGMDTVEAFTPEFIRNISKLYFLASKHGLNDLAENKCYAASTIPIDLKEPSEMVNKVFDRVLPTSEQKADVELYLENSNADEKKRKEEYLKRNIMANIISLFHNMYSAKQIEKAFGVVSKEMDALHEAEECVTKEVLKILLNPNANEKKAETKIKSVKTKKQDINPAEFPRFANVLK